MWVPTAMKAPGRGVQGAPCGCGRWQGQLYGGRSGLPSDLVGGVCMSVHTRTHTCTLSYTHTVLHTHSHPHLHSYTGTHFYTHMHFYTHIVLHIHTLLHIYVCTHLHIHTVLHVHSLTLTVTHTHTHFYTYTHSYIHTQIHTHTLYSCSQSYTHCLLHAYTYMLTHILLQSHTLTFTHAHSCTLIHTHPYTHTVTHSQIHTLSHVRSYTLTLSHSYTHILNTHMHAVTKCRKTAGQLPEHQQAPRAPVAAELGLRPQAPATAPHILLQVRDPCLIHGGWSFLWTDVHPVSLLLLPPLLPVHPSVSKQTQSWLPKSWPFLTPTALVIITHSCFPSPSAMSHAPAHLGFGQHKGGCRRKASNSSHKGMFPCSASLLSLLPLPLLPASPPPSSLHRFSLLPRPPSSSLPPLSSFFLSPSSLLAPLFPPPPSSSLLPPSPRSLLPAPCILLPSPRSPFSSSSPPTENTARSRRGLPCMCRAGPDGCTVGSPLPVSPPPCRGLRGSWRWVWRGGMGWLC